jgi:hypothetical protein
MIKPLLLSILLLVSTSALADDKKDWCEYSASVYAQAQAWKDRGASRSDVKAKMMESLRSRGLDSNKGNVDAHMKIIDDVYDYKTHISPETWYEYVLRECISTKVKG